MHTQRTYFILTVLTLGWLMAFVSPLHAAPYVVNSTADTAVEDGQCTLREALMKATRDESHPDCTGTEPRIKFDLPANAVITLHERLRWINRDLTISSSKPLTIRRADDAPPFRILGIARHNQYMPDADAKEPIVKVTLEGLTLSNGKAMLPSPFPEFLAEHHRTYTYNYGGGGIINQGHLILKNCKIIGNHAESVGGGISNLMQSYSGQTEPPRIASVKMYNTLVADNSAHFRGGGVYNGGGELWIQDSIIHNNALVDLEINELNALQGAGVSNRNNSAKATVVNSVLSNNRIILQGDHTNIFGTMGMGAGFHSNKHAHSLLVNSTIVNNEIQGTRAKGAGLYQSRLSNDEDAGSLTMHNSIVVGNTRMFFGREQYDNLLVQQPENIIKSIVASAEAEENQLATLFDIPPDVYPPRYIPAANSQFINAGDTKLIQQLLPSINQDIAGHPRISGDHVDIGAYEYQFPTPPESPSQLALIVAANGKGAVTVISHNRSRTCRTACNYGYANASFVSLIATAEPDYRFTGWNNPMCAGRFLLDTPTTCIAKFRSNRVDYVSNPPPHGILHFTSAVGHPTTKSLNLQNREVGQLTVELLGLNGTQAEAFTLAPDSLPLMLENKATARIDIGCQPNLTTTATAHLDLRTNDRDWETVSYFLKCTPAATALPSNPSTVPVYGSQPIAETAFTFITAAGQPTTQTLNLISLGTAALTIDDLTLHGTDAAAFSLANAPVPFSLAAFTAEQATQHPIMLGCNPPEVGIYQATLQILSNDPNQPVNHYPLSCEAQPQIAPVEQQVTLQRIGSGHMRLNGQLCADPPCQYSLPMTATVSLSATPATGWRFGRWRCQGLKDTTTNPLEMSLTHELICIAEFQPPQQLELIVSGGGRIDTDHPLMQVACDDHCVYNVPPELEGQTLALEVTPDLGWLFTGWQGSCTSESIIQLSPAQNCEPKPVAHELMVPLSLQKRFYHVFHDDPGYHLSIEIDKFCVAESLRLDYSALWAEIRTTDVKLKQLNDLCVATFAADTDGDSILDEIEQAAPNGGDANYDGIADFQQANVISARHDDIRYTSIELAVGCEPSNVVLHPEEVWSALGAVDFEIRGECSHTQVRMLWYNTNEIDLAEAETGLQLQVTKMLLPGERGGRYYYTLPYLRTFIRNGEVVRYKNEFPVIEALSYLQTTPFPKHDDLILTIETNPYPFLEAQESYTLKATLSRPITEPLTVYYGDLTALEPSNQTYQLSGDHLTWTPGGSLTQTLTITTEDDDRPEDDLSIRLYFGNASRPYVYYKPDSLISVYLYDDDTLTPCTPTQIHTQGPQRDPNATDKLFNCDMQDSKLSSTDLNEREANTPLQLNHVEMTSPNHDPDGMTPSDHDPDGMTPSGHDPDSWLTLSAEITINQGKFKTNVHTEGATILGSPTNPSVFYHHADLQGSRLAYVWFANDPTDPEQVNIIRNHSSIAHAIIDANVELRGGTLDGDIVNHGQLVSIEFIGQHLSGGNVAGMITLHPESVMQDVTLNTVNSRIRTSVLGGKLAGRIIGDAHLPAKLTQLTILPNAHLSNVMFSENITFTDNLTLSGVIAGDTHYPPVLLENVQIQANSELNHVILGQNVVVDNGVIFGDGVHIAPDANISCRNASRLSADAVSTPSPACFFNHFAWLPPADRQSAHSTAAEQAHLRMTVLTDPRDFKHAAELVVVAVVQTPYGAVAYMRDGDTWLEWDGELTGLTALKSEPTLKRQYDLSLYRGELTGFDGAFTLYAGYRLSSGDIVYNGPSPFDFTLSTPHQLELDTRRDTSEVNITALSNSVFTSFIQAAPENDTQRQGDMPVNIKHIRQHIHVDPLHQQQAGDVLAVMLTTSGELYRLDSSQTWQVWSGEFAELTGIYSVQQLPAQLQLNVVLPVEQVDVVYVGYRVTAADTPDVIVFNGGYPLTFVVND